jgi:hypothetical protein
MHLPKWYRVCSTGQYRVDKATLAASCELQDISANGGSGRMYVRQAAVNEG